MEDGRKKILVSACLMGGVPCRYDGGEKPCLHPVFLNWKKEGRLVPVCPETAGGLPVPRPPAEQRRAPEENSPVVQTENGTDVTAAFLRGAHEALRLARAQDVCFCILKEKSPSCGVHEVYDGTFSGTKTSGTGVTTALLTASGFRVFSEEELDAAARCAEAAL